MAKDQQFQFKGKFPITLLKEGEIFVAFCPILDSVGSYGDTPDEAMQNFNEALIGTIALLQEEGKLKVFLESCGWSIKKEKQQTYIIPPLIIKTVDYSTEQMNQLNNSLMHA